MTERLFINELCDRWSKSADYVLACAIDNELPLWVSLRDVWILTFKEYLRFETHNTYHQEQIGYEPSSWLEEQLGPSSGFFRNANVRLLSEELTTLRGQFNPDGSVNFGRKMSCIGSDGLKLTAYTHQGLGLSTGKLSVTQQQSSGIIIEKKNLFARMEDVETFENKNQFAVQDGRKHVPTVMPTRDIMAEYTLYGKEGARDYLAVSLSSITNYINGGMPHLPLTETDGIYRFKPADIKKWHEKHQEDKRKKLKENIKR